MSNEARPIRSCGSTQIAGWRLRKAEVVAFGDVADGVWDQAISLAQTELDARGKRDADSGHGFLAVHDGYGGDVLFLGLWTNQNELAHYAWSGPKGGPYKVAGRGETVACVWDVALMYQEREMWLKHMLRTDSPDSDAYLADSYSVVE